MNVQVNTFFPECAGRPAESGAAYPPALASVAENARPGRRERHVSCYLRHRRRCTNDGTNDGNFRRGSGRSVRGGYGMAVEWDRDHHVLRGGRIGSDGPDTPHHSPGGGRASGDSPCRIVEAIHPVSAHLSTRPFGPDRCSNLRPHCGMTAEFTENLTLSRAHALGDSPWSLEGRSLAAPWGPAIWLLRMRLAAIQSGTQRMACAILGAPRVNCLTYCKIKRYEDHSRRAETPADRRASKVVKIYLLFVGIIFLIAGSIRNYTCVNLF
jgi:hypothetical protein